MQEILKQVQDDSGQRMTKNVDLFSRKVAKTLIEPLCGSAPEASGLREILIFCNFPKRFN